MDGGISPQIRAVYRPGSHMMKLKLLDVLLILWWAISVFSTLLYSRLIAQINIWFAASSWCLSFPRDNVQPAHLFCKGKIFSMLCTQISYISSSRVFLPFCMSSYSCCYFNVVIVIDPQNKRQYVVTLKSLWLPGLGWIISSLQVVFETIWWKKQKRT